jgi:putative acetyltransferase
MHKAETIVVRRENNGSLAERAAIHSINEAAFGGGEEADLVDNLRASGDVLVSLVAEYEARTAGHILFSRMWIGKPGGLVPAVALAPLAVLPECQRRGIGGALIRHGLELLRALDEKLVIVVGHPGYYPRFGFSSEKARGLDSPFPAEAFMALEVQAGALDGIRGRVIYPAAFGL